MLIGVAFAQEAGDAAQQAPGGGLSPIFFIVLFIAIFYFFLIRPQQKREKERREMLNALSKGDEVVTNGGIFGKIVGLDDKTVVLRVSEEPLVKLELVRGAISKVVTSEDRGGEQA